MTAITASMVKELRQATGAGMMECKKALVEAAGDMDVAIDNMRKSGQAKAAKRAGRVAAEGIVVAAHNADMTVASLVEVNCETDFVARDEGFNGYAKELAAAALGAKANAVDVLMSQKLADGQTAEQTREALVLKIGENIKARRVASLQADGIVASYIHGGRIGVLVALDKKDEALAKDVAMHVAATNPAAIDADDLPKELVEKEREIITAQAATSGKPDNIIEKMVAGRLDKFVKENCLVGQPFVKNPDETVGKLLAAQGAKVLAFIRFEVGEGIEKQTTDLAKEVSETLKGSE